MKLLELIKSFEDLKNAGAQCVTVDSVLKNLSELESLGFDYTKLRFDIEGAINDAVSRAERRINDDSCDYIDYDSASFTINYNNTVELESLELDAYAISGEFQTAINDALNDYFDEFEENNKTNNNDETEESDA